MLIELLYNTGSVLMEHYWDCMCVPLKLAEIQGKTTGKQGTDFLAHTQNKLLILGKADRKVARCDSRIPCECFNFRKGS